MGACSSKPPPPNPERIDLTHFDLLKVVGKGGFGKVNAVTKLDTNELMALKRLEKAAVLSSKSHLRMVWIERKIMAMCDSPFLCNLLYAFESDRELFLVMPFMQGGDLRFHLKERGTMPQEVCVFYAAQMALGLEHLHSKRIVFRDLKPENMLLDAQGNLRISDFGLACVLEEKNKFLTTGQAGTRGYQAPEVLQDHWYGTEVDIWSFGVTVYELLHGCRPFKDYSKLVGAVGGAVADSAATAGTSNDDAAFDPMTVFSHFHISSKLSKDVHDFLRALLTVDKRTRLLRWRDIKQHAFFKTISWDLIASKRADPPIQPDLSRANCTADADLADQLLDRKPRAIPLADQENFKGWSYRTELNKPIDPKAENNNNNSTSSSSSSSSSSSFSSSSSSSSSTADSSSTSASTTATTMTTTTTTTPPTTTSSTSTATAATDARSSRGESAFDSGGSVVHTNGVTHHNSTVALLTTIVTPNTTNTNNQITNHSLMEDSLTPSATAIAATAGTVVPLDLDKQSKQEAKTDE